jgi:hypothetical protein
MDPGLGLSGSGVGGATVSCHEFLTYLYDRPETRELALVLAAATLREPVDHAPDPLPSLRARPLNAA